MPPGLGLPATGIARTARRHPAEPPLPAASLASLRPCSPTVPSRMGSEHPTVIPSQAPRTFFRPAAFRPAAFRPAARSRPRPPWTRPGFLAPPRALR